MINLYAIEDNVTGNFDIPFFCSSDLFAERKFVIMARDNKNTLFHFKNDFNLVRIATFDPETGEIKSDKYTVIEGKAIERERANNTEARDVDEYRKNLNDKKRRAR